MEAIDSALRFQYPDAAQMARDLEAEATEVKAWEQAIREYDERHPDPEILK